MTEANKQRLIFDETLTEFYARAQVLHDALPPDHRDRLRNPRMIDSDGDVIGGQFICIKFHYEPA